MVKEASQLCSRAATYVTGAAWGRCLTLLPAAAISRYNRARLALPVRFEALLLRTSPRGHVGWSTDRWSLLAAGTQRSRNVPTFPLCAVTSWRKHKRIAWWQRTKDVQPLSTLSDRNLVRVGRCSQSRSRSRSGRRSCSHAAGANNIVQAELTARAEERSECRGPQRDNDAASARGCCSTGSSCGRSVRTRRQRRVRRRQ